MLKKLSKLKVNQFLSVLGENSDIYAPIKKGDYYELDKLQDDVNYNFFEPTYTSFKKILVPQCQKLYNFSKGSFSNPSTDRSTIIFGMSNLDIQALNLLKDIMSKPVIDQPFSNKLEQTVFVASVKSSIRNLELEIEEMADGYDILLIQANDDFYLNATSTRGKDIVSLMKLPNSSFSIKKTQNVEFGLFKDKEKIVKALEYSRGKAIWKKLATKCIGCGNCTAICPLCYCFDIKHNYSPEQRDGTVIREWDSCFFKSFAATSGHNFRAEFEDRIYHFFEHKFIQAYYERGEFNCNHCGKCVKACPANINIFKVIDQVVKDYEASNAGK